MNNSNKRLKVFIPLLFSLVLILGMFFGFKLRDFQGYKQASLSPTKSALLHQVLKLIELKYVDTLPIPKLKSQAVNGLLKHLDPHSVYIPPNKVRAVQEDMQGSFHGIGIGYFIIKDTIQVSHVIPGGPAEKTRMMIGDKIIKKDDSLLAGVNITPERIKKILRGPLHSNITLEVLRNDSLFHLRVKRGIIPLKSIDAAYMIEPGVAYVRINRFSAHTYSEFMDSVVVLKKAHTINKFILDLRNNPGGYLKSAVNIADEFLKEGQLVVSVKGKSYPDEEFITDKSGEFENIPLAVLVNGHSASASEIFAGAIQDWDRGYIIGRQTFGKGLVQEQYRLTNGAALRLTVARYYLPSGRLIQRPYKDRRKAYAHDLLKRYEHGELLHKDSIHFQDTTTYFTKKEHRKVHAGGGILPDIFVPIDTTQLSPHLISLYRGHLLFLFAHEYLRQHPELFQSFKSAREFSKAEILPDSILKRLVHFAPDSAIHPPEKFSPHEAELVKLQIKAFIARELWPINGYYTIIDQRDTGIKKAIETLEKEPDLKSLAN